MIMLTPRDIAVLAALAEFYVLTRSQLQRLCFQNDQTGRVTRRRLLKLADAKLLSRHRVAVYNSLSGTPAPIYFPSARGNEHLAAHFDDDRFLLTPTQTPQTHHIAHWIAISETHMRLKAAIEGQRWVKLNEWVNEWDVVNKDETAPDKHFRLYTLLSEMPRLVCAPDAAFLLNVDEHTRVYFLEQDRDTSGVRQVAASKTKGYAAMAEQQAHQRLFPSTTMSDFSVLMIAPTPRRRDMLRKAISAKPGAHLWRFIAANELTATSALHEPIVYRCQDGPFPLVKPQEAVKSVKELAEVAG